MSEVWLAEDQRLGRWVAVKLLREGFATAGDGDLVRSFEREARVIAQLQHPNIVGVYDAGTYDGRYYVVMEYVHGYALRQMLEAQGRLGEQDVIRYGVQAAAALQYAHDHAVIHCDVKPENILVTEEGVPKLADFGVAETATRTLSPEQARDVLGTIAYLAPEVIQGANADPRSDVYSLAMTLYEAVAGRLPFAGTTPAALAGQRLAGAAPPVRTFAREVSPEFETVLARGLALSPLDRYQSAAEFATAMRRVPVHAPGLAAAASPTGAVVRRPAPQRDSPLRQRNPTARVSRRPPPDDGGGGLSGGAFAAIVVVIVVALGLGGLAAWLVSNNDNANGGSTTPTVAPTQTAAVSPTAAPTKATPTDTPAPSPTPSPTPTATQPPKSPSPSPTATKTVPTAAASVTAIPSPTTAATSTP